MSRAKEKDATEDYRTLDVRALHRAGVLVPGWSGGWHWTRRREKVADINIQVEGKHRLRLRYRVTTRGEAEARDYPLAVTWTPCHLGGVRPWFLCPCCSRRVAILYGGAGFACRHCRSLNYASQQASKRDRAADRSWDLRRALGCTEGFLSTPAEYIRKPKGMHWRTFFRRIDQIKRLDARALSDTGAMLASIERRIRAASKPLSRL